MCFLFFIPCHCIFKICYVYLHCLQLHQHHLSFLTAISPSAQNKAGKFSETFSENRFRKKMWTLQMSFSGFKKAGHPVLWFLSLAGRSALTIIIAVVVCAVLLVLVLILVFIHKRKKLGLQSYYTHTFTLLYTYSQAYLCGEKTWLVKFFFFFCLHFFTFFLSGYQHSKNTVNKKTQNDPEVRKHLCK